MTKEQIADLAWLENKATGFPWTFRTQSKGDPAIVRGPGGRQVALCDDHDAALIATMRNMLPSLLVDALKLAEAREARAAFIKARWGDDSQMNDDLLQYTDRLVAAERALGLRED